jgi:hypothetical protein
MPGKTTKQTICPVCGDPLGNDPHEACFDKVRNAMTDETPEHAQPCPACGKPMVHMACKNEDCENFFPDV